MSQEENHPAMCAGSSHQSTDGAVHQFSHGLDGAGGTGSVPTASRGYRIRRRNRPTHVSTGIAQEVDLAMTSVDGETFLASSLLSHAVLRTNDVPLPTIEKSAPSPPSFFITEGCSDGFREDGPSDVFPNASSDAAVPRAPPPRTPSPNMMRNPLLGGWSKTRFGRSSSSDSLSSLASSQGSSYDSGTWSAARGAYSISPESEADPVAISKSSSHAHAASLSQGSTLRRNGSDDWTPEMDEHIWKVYNAYLEDPTVTPYKCEPGTPPPTGVSHRIARKVRRTWSHADVVARSLHRERETGSGSVTPKASMHNLLSHWPKSGNATRDRLRTLCQRFGAPDPFTVASRSLSPVTTSRRHSPTPRSGPLASSLPDHLTSSFARDVHLSLMTSTSDTMQPDGPLARLAATPVTSDGSAHRSMLPPVPFASPATMPSSRLPSSDLWDMDLDPVDATDTAMSSPPGPRLGSPFPHHSWGASNPFRVAESRREAVASFPSSILQSPIRLEPSLPESNMHKRRATNDLDDHSPPHHASLAQAALIDVLGPSDASLRRRVRARGQVIAGPQNPRLGATFGSLSHAPTTPSPSTAVTGSLSNLPLEFALARPATASTTGRLAAPIAATDTPRRLLSPFEGITGRPARSRGHAHGGNHARRDSLVDSSHGLGR